MKFQIKKSTGGIGFARKADYEYEGTQFEADIKNGDIVKLLDGGAKEIGQYGEQDIFKIKTRNGEKRLALNQSTINVLVMEFDNESENWVGKDVKVILQKKVIAGKKSIIPYLVVEGWSLDEYGELMKAGSTMAKDIIGGEEVEGEPPF